MNLWNNFNEVLFLQELRVNFANIATSTNSECSFLIYFADKVLVGIGFFTNVTAILALFFLNVIIDVFFGCEIDQAPVFQKCVHSDYTADISRKILSTQRW